MRRLHFTQHGGRTSGDALDLFLDEASLLRELFAKWNTTTPEFSAGGSAVTAKWDHGTVGKLILEHAAVRLAAGDELSRVLKDLGNEHPQLSRTNRLIRPVLDQMYDCARGVHPISAAITPGFVEAVAQLQELLRPELGGSSEHLVRSELTAALGTERARLRSATFIRKHAPARPGRVDRWYDRIPFLLRLHAGVDRLSGFPWGESRLGDRKLAERYDHEL